MKKNILFIIASSCLILASCNKKITNSSNSVNMMYSSVEEFKDNNSSIAAAYIGGNAGGFFKLTNDQNIKGSAAMNGIYIKRSDGKVFVRDEYSTTGVVRPEWFGAVGNGRNDDWEAFSAAIEVVTELNGTLVTGSKHYHISKPLYFSNEGKASCMWIGNGAQLDNTVVIKSRETTIKDLKVVGSPNEGFIWKRGQGGLFENLRAENCKKAGFAIGAQEGNQVAWATFNNLISIGNEHGFLVDGTSKKNWVNANSFIGLYARGNHKYGVWIKGIANYNTWTGLHCEGNDSDKKNIAVVLIEKGKDNVFIGGHIVSPSGNTTPTVVDNGARNIYLGGRYVAGSPQVKSVIDNINSQIDISHKVTRNPGQGRLKSRSSERKLNLKSPVNEAIDKEQ